MGQILYEQFDGWVEGVNTSVEPDDLPTNALPRARNTAITHLASGKAVVEHRPGLVAENSNTALTGTPAIQGMYEFNTQSSGTVTRRLLAVGADGSLWTSGTDRAFTVVSTALTSGATLYPDFETAQNYCFVVNGTDAKIYTGSALGDFGITRPTVGTMAGAAGAAGLHNGTYALRVTYGISAIGAESSASDTATSTVLVTNQAITWSNIPTSSNPLVDRRYLYVRNTATQANFYRAATITNNTATSATTTILDTSLVTRAPSTTDHDAPPSGIRYLAHHRSRMFVADDKDLYWSQLGQPMAFDTTVNKVNVNPNDGQKVTGLAVFNDVLLVFKERSTYVVVGDDPNSWVIRLLTPAIGCLSHRSIVAAEERLYWVSHEGPAAWDGTGTPKVIGKPFLLTTLTDDIPAYQNATTACAGHDATGQRVLFTYSQDRVDADGTTTVVTGGLTLPFNYRLQRWESDGWDPMRVGCWAEAYDSSGVRQLYLGNLKGQVFRLAGDDDAATGGTLTGTMTASGTTLGTITGTGFLNTGAKLVERMVTVLDSTGRFVARRYITANDATSLTLDANIAVTNGAVYTYHVGGIYFELDTPWTDMGQPFHKKRFEYLYLLAEAETASTPVTVILTLDATDTIASQRVLSFNPDETTGIQLSPQRLRVGRTGRSLRARLICPAANQHLSLGAIGLRAELLTDRLH